MYFVYYDLGEQRELKRTYGDVVMAVTVERALM